MSKRMKKLISMLLTAAMVLSSAGIIALADESTKEPAQTAPVSTEDPDATPEPTEDVIDSPDAEDATPEPTEAPEEPTPEPTETPSRYENDAYYNRAIPLVTALGIITGYEDGSIQPDSNVTRAEMATIVLRMLNTATDGEYNGAFNDVTADHWAAGTIQTAAGLGIINGMGDGSFRPDGNVTYEQVAKMIVCALGYDTQAQMNGGYPSGYLNQANSLKINDSALGTVGVPADRGLVIKMVYNALLTLYNEPTGVGEAGRTTYSATRTLAKAKFNVIDAKGVLTATAKTSLDPSFANLQEGQIAIDSTQYDTELTGLEDLIGTTVTYFYIETSAMQVPEVLAVTTSSSAKSETTTVDLDNVDYLTGFDSGKGEIVMEKGSSYKCRDAVINYNGVIITPADFARAQADDTEDRFAVRDYKGDVIEKMTFNDLLNPAHGAIRLTDSDGDGYYDYVFVDSYETMTVTSVSAKRVVGLINNTSVVLDVDTDSNQDLLVTVTKNGSTVRPRNLSQDDVASVKRSLDNLNIEIEVTGANVTGTVSSVGEIDGKYMADIDGKDYEVDANAVADMKPNSTGTFYTDKFDRIAFADATGSNKISGSEKYGWIMNAYVGDDGEEIFVKIYDQDGEAKEYNLASTVNFWGPRAKAAETLSGSARSRIADMSSSFVKTGDYPIRLCKFRTNSAGQISKLYIAVDSAAAGIDDEDPDAVVVDTKNLNGIGSLGSLINGRVIEDGMIGFSVPNDETEMNTASNYNTFSVNSGLYLSTEGVRRDFILGEFTDSRTASVLVQFEQSTNAAAQTTDYGTVDDNPVMVVKSVGQGVDEDGDPIYIIKGMRSGSEVSYQTTANTTLAKMNNADQFTDKNFYNTTTIWTAKDNKDSIANYLHEGDVVGVKSNAAGASILIKMVDINELVKLATTGSGDQFTGHDDASETRDGIIIGSIDSVDTPDTTYLNLNYASGSGDWLLDSAVAVDLVEITTGRGGTASVNVAKDVLEPAELAAFDAANVEGDYIFLRHFKNNAQREAIVFRFNY